MAIVMHVRSEKREAAHDLVTYEVGITDTEEDAFSTRFGGHGTIFISPESPLQLELGQFYELSFTPVENPYPEVDWDVEDGFWLDSDGEFRVGSDIDEASLRG